MKVIKFLIVGDGDVGKTSLITKYTMDYIRDEYIPTVFDTYFNTNLKVSKDALLLEFWDSGGSKEHARYRTPLSYANTDVVLICFSVVCPESFENIELKWYPEIRRFCPNTPICLVGMKSDLLEDMEIRDKLDKEQKPPVLLFEGLQLAEKIGAYKYCECSAMTGYQVEGVFDRAINVVLRNKFLRKNSFWEDHADGTF